jgi:hypothetical protein
VEDKNINYSSEDEFIKSTIEYLINGKYLIVLSCNLIYFIPRILMNNIHLLGITYGQYGVNAKDTPGNHWWNAESQLSSCCRKYDIAIYNSRTHLEFLTICKKYEHDIYYSNYSKNEIKDDNFSFFIKRK